MKDADACFRKGEDYDSNNKKCIPMTEARTALDEKTLKRQYRINGRITTFKDEIDKGTFVRTEVKQVPSIDFNRTKYNRMAGKEQEEYEEKLNTLKTEYRLFERDGAFFRVPKAVYMYAKAKGI